MYPAFSPSPSVKNYSYGPPHYAAQGYPIVHQGAHYGPSGQPMGPPIGQSFRAVTPEKPQEKE